MLMRREWHFLFLALALDFSFFSDSIPGSSH
ncbi:hypothetical protein CJA_0493 [Cellvibrio japonicus Ueda107]|uniref:Uncharacterized protein n=1 Tax=Cellvibrio japonicus (strain Ueda107) TaxID=498211 RepID=B3PIY2_CELJU|nr:hypothetical protein CJA_0493 [Cellvibrio japonicus Ueda107]